MFENLVDGSQNPIWRLVRFRRIMKIALKEKEIVAMKQSRTAYLFIKLGHKFVSGHWFVVILGHQNNQLFFITIHLALFFISAAEKKIVYINCTRTVSNDNLHLVYLTRGKFVEKELRTRTERTNTPLIYVQRVNGIIQVN